MLDRVGGIAIEKGPMPTMKVAGTRGRCNERTLMVRTAIEKIRTDPASDRYLKQARATGMELPE